MILIISEKITGSLTTAQVSEQLGVHPVTLRKWRTNSVVVDAGRFGDEWMEDSQGLNWKFEHPRKVVYCAKSVQWLKNILQRRKNK